MKVVTWRGFFADIHNTRYAVDIYADGDSSTQPKIIDLGATPLTTEEDDNDDIFTPVRTQTGTLEVLDPDGTLMEEMLPADNLDHPVRVYEVATGKVVWQGFLSCETYTQGYTARAQVVEFNLKSVLEVMKSVKIGDDVIERFGTIISLKDLIEYALLRTSEHIQVIWPYDADYYFGEKYIYTSYLFDVKTTSTILDGDNVHRSYKTCYDVIEGILQLTLHTIRERANRIYIQKHTGAFSGEEIRMSDLEFAGTNHTKTYSSGAGRVTVSGSVNKCDDSIELPKCPTMPPLDNVCYRVQGASNDRRIIMYEQKETKLFSNISLNTYSVQNVGMSTDPRYDYIPDPYVDITPYSTLSNDSRNQGAKLASGTVRTFYIGSRMCKSVANFDRLYYGDKRQNPESGLHCYFVPYTHDIGIYGDRQVAPIFTMKSVKRMRFTPGYITIDWNAMSYGWKDGESICSSGLVGDVPIIVKIGDYYLKDNGIFSTEPSVVWLHKGNGSSFSTRFLHTTDGVLEISILPILCDIPSNPYSEVTFGSLSLKYEPENIGYNDGTKNSYSLDIEGNFTDEISHDLDIMSFNSNINGENLLRNADGTMNMDGIVEIESLNDLYEHYRKVNQINELYIRPTEKDLPNLLLVVPNGSTPEEGYTRMFPVSESRDWGMDVSTIKLIEA